MKRSAELVIVTRDIQGAMDMEWKLYDIYKLTSMIKAATSTELRNDNSYPCTNDTIAPKNVTRGNGNSTYLLPI